MAPPILDTGFAESEWLTFETATLPQRKHHTVPAEQEARCTTEPAYTLPVKQTPLANIGNRNAISFLPARKLGLIGVLTELSRP